MTGWEVKGLSEAVANLTLLNGDLKMKIGRAALLAGALVVNQAVKGATYTTFKRQTGMIRSGFGVRVGAQLKGTVLNSVVVEYPQSVAGATTMAHLFNRAHRSTISGRSLNQVAFWWRFLEFGTGARKSVRKPTWINRRPARSQRERHALEKFNLSGNRGAISPRPWVRPALAASAQQGIDMVEKTMRDRIETEVANLPK